MTSRCCRRQACTRSGTKRSRALASACRNGAKRSRALVRLARAKGGSNSRVAGAKANTFLGCSQIQWVAGVLPPPPLFLGCSHPSGQRRPPFNQMAAPPSGWAAQWAGGDLPPMMDVGLPNMNSPNSAGHHAPRRWGELPHDARDSAAGPPAAEDRARGAPPVCARAVRSASLWFGGCPARAVCGARGLARRADRDAARPLPAFGARAVHRAPADGLRDRAAPRRPIPRRGSRHLHRQIRVARAVGADGQREDRAAADAQPAVRARGRRQQRAHAHR